MGRNRSRRKLAREEHRAGRVAQHVLGGRAKYHLDDPAVPVGADEQQVGVVLLEELHDLLVGVPLQQLELCLGRVVFEVGARLSQGSLAELGIARVIIPPMPGLFSTWVYRVNSYC